MNDDRSQLRVAVLTNTIPTYRRPVFEKLARAPGITLHMFLSLPLECCDPRAQDVLSISPSSGLNLRWKTRHRDVGTVQLETTHIPIGLYFQLTSFRPDVVIAGEMGPRSFVAYLAAARFRIPFIIWSEEIVESARGVSGIRNHLRRFLMERASAFLAWGRPAAAYLSTYGVPESQIHLCAQAVDNEFWREAATHAARLALRAELNVTGRAFLAVGRLVERKGFDHLLRAWARIPLHVRDDHTLILVGSGPEESRLRNLAAELDLDAVRFVGAHYEKDLARYYAAADVFVFPSLVDVWGLVVNEALACGVPVIASRFAGASQQLVTDERNGTLVDPTDVEQFGAILCHWCVRESLPDKVQCRDALRDVTFEVTVGAIRQAVQRVTDCHASESACAMPPELGVK